MSNLYYNPYTELYHHGVKGQKWGVRRYQNSDGSLTPEGKEHYHKQIERERKLSKAFTGVYGATVGGMLGEAGYVVGTMALGTLPASAVAAMPAAIIGAAAIGGVIGLKTLGQQVDFSAEDAHMHIESGKYFMEHRANLTLN